VIGLDPGAFDPRDARQIGQFAGGLERVDEIGEGPAMGEQDRRGRRLPPRMGLRHRREERGADQAANGGKSRRQRLAKAEDNIVAIDSEPRRAWTAARSDQTGRDRTVWIEDRIGELRLTPAKGLIDRRRAHDEARCAGGQGADLLETRGWADRASGVIVV
jgi:hypothetical protein